MSVGRREKIHRFNILPIVIELHIISSRIGENDGLAHSFIGSQTRGLLNLCSINNSYTLSTSNKLCAEIVFLFINFIFHISNWIFVLKEQDEA